MITLQEMTLVELANEYASASLTSMPSRAQELPAVNAELARRQAMLDAAEVMVRAIDLLGYQAALTPPSETIQLDISRCRDAVAAYTAAKGDR